MSLLGEVQETFAIGSGQLHNDVSSQWSMVIFAVMQPTYWHAVLCHHVWYTGQKDVSSKRLTSNWKNKYSINVLFHPIVHKQKHMVYVEVFQISTFFLMSKMSTWKREMSLFLPSVQSGTKYYRDQAPRAYDRTSAEIFSGGTKKETHVSSLVHISHHGQKSTMILYIKTH